jgi:hypothetical protein
MEFMENEPYEDYTHLDSDAQPEFATELIDMASREGTLMEYDVVVEMEDGTILSPVDLSLERTEAAYKAQELVVVEADSLAYGFPDRSLASTIVALTLRCLGPPIYEARWSFWGRFEKMAKKDLPNQQNNSSTTLSEGFPRAFPVAGLLGGEETSLPGCI